MEDFIPSNDVLFIAARLVCLVSFFFFQDLLVWSFRKQVACSILRLLFAPFLWVNDELDGFLSPDVG